MSRIINIFIGAIIILFLLLFQVDSQWPNLVQGTVEQWYAKDTGNYSDRYKESSSTLSTRISLLESTCVDSDGGLNYEVAGFVEGTGPNGWPYEKRDVCETGEYEGNLKEFYCSSTIPIGRRYSCPLGCLEGACLSDPPTCIDLDNDSYSVSGGVCGSLDCDDNNPHINPGAEEVCANSIDDDCDTFVDMDDPQCQICTDLDLDGFAIEGGGCGPVDCDDSRQDIFPGANEICDNGLDDNCNGDVDLDDPACGAPANVIVIGWDGTQRDHLWQCYNQELDECPFGLPNLSLVSSGNILNITITNGDTVTKPGWAQIFSGYNSEVMGIFSNGDYQPLPEGYSVFEKLETHFGSENIITMFISGKSVNTGGACIGDPTTKNGLPIIEDKGQPWCLTKAHLDYYENDLRQNSVVGNRALELLEEHQNDLFFALFLFRTPDVIGHLTGESSIHYSEAIVENDEWLGRIMEKLEELNISDNTLIYVTTDHGFDEASDRHGNAPYGFLASNDPFVIRSGDRKDLAACFLERFGVSLGAINGIPAIDGYSLFSYPPIACVPESEAFLDYPGAPTCCAGLTLIGLGKLYGNLYIPATGGTGDNSGFCTRCGNGECLPPENGANCPEDCP